MNNPTTARRKFAPVKSIRHTWCATRSTPGQRLVNAARLRRFSCSARWPLVNRVIVAGMGKAVQLDSVTART